MYRLRYKVRIIITVRSFNRQAEVRRLLLQKDGEETYYLLLFIIYYYLLFIIWFTISQFRRAAQIEQCIKMLWFDAFQKPLPKVPVPELKETLNKYLQCIKPIVSDEQYACTQKCVDEFGKTGGLGEYLQRKLIEYAETRENWVSIWGQVMGE